MSQRDWRTPTVFALTALLFIGAITYAAWHTGASQAEKRMSRQQDAKHHIQYAEDRIDQTCVQTDRESFLKCVHDEIKSAQDHGRAKSDLDAQMAMALWAKIMTFSGVVSSILAGGGLYMVWRTLETTGDAVQAANTTNKIMREEQRPWVTLEKEFHCEFSDRGSFQGMIAWNKNFRNKGKTPAFDIQTHVKLIKGEYGFSAMYEMKRFTEKCIQTNKGRGMPILYPGEVTNLQPYTGFQSDTYDLSRNADGKLEKKEVKGDEFGLIFCITYRLGLALDSPIGVETRGFHIEGQEGAYGPWTHRLREFSSELIVK